VCGEEVLKKLLICGASLLSFCLTYVGAAKADDIHLCATALACQGSAGSVQFTTSTTAYVFGKGSAGDTLYVALLAPVAGTSGNWNSGELWSVLGESLQVFPTLSSAISQLGTAGFTAASFNVADYLVGSWAGETDTAPASFTLPGSPTAGDMYMGFVEDARGKMVAVSPWSSSLVLVNVPEPSSLILLSAGLLGVLALAGKKLLAA